MEATSLKTSKEPMKTHLKMVVLNWNAPIVLVLLLVLKTTTSSQAGTYHDRSSTLSTLSSSGAPEAEVGPNEMSVQVTLLSARGSLAFWWPSDPLLSADLAELDTDPKSPFQATKQPSQSTKCHAHNRALSGHLGGFPIQLRRPADPAELLAVEGTSLKLNLVIVGQLATHLPTGARLLSEPAYKLKLEWTRNGQPVALNKGRFSQQLINENDMERQFFGGQQAASAGSRNATSSSKAYNMINLSEFGHLETFMLAPYVSERALGRVEPASANNKPLQTRLNHLLNSKRAHPSNPVDDFLAEGHSIDWQKLETYLRSNAYQLGLHLSGPEHDKECQSGSIDQLLILQVDLNHLTMSDQGLYQLQVCPSKDQRICQQVSFLLQLVQDVPRLESWPQDRVLEPGDRFSIKCEATGFTLPQITWFLDGQQLNEHQLASYAGSHSHTSSLGLSGSQLRLRIGDYVSQDNHVHSFVNSSHVQLTDGGFYKCQANNGFHSVEHETRIDVRGPPTIARSLGNVSVLVGQNQLHIQCPYSGFPIHSVEWYYRPSGGNSVGQLRARRGHATAGGPSFPLRKPENLIESADPEQDQDPDKDEWLSQASAMTPPSREDYPDPLPDYPVASLIPSSESYEDDDEAAPADGISTDYSDIPMDMQQASSRSRRRRREASSEQSGWLKFPQSRRHQIHSNGTLTIQELSRADQGFYKCRVVVQSGEHEDSAGNMQGSSSNEFHLTVLVPPVISPFSSAESLREGMRNFLTCSVIEGDPPVRLHWLKDGQPIEEYIQSSLVAGQPADTWDQAAWLQHPGNSQSQQQTGRIRMETSNEYTSTLYFSHVDFKDNGNYTCVATNKAANVNYTARMLVNVAPKWVKAPKDVECVSGQSIVIDCQAQAYPSARVWWEIGVHSSQSEYSQPGAATKTKAVDLVSPLNKALALQHQTPNHYRTIISNSRIHILENASLVIKDVNKLDQGYYLCQAANNFGSLSSLIKLTVNVGASFSSKYLMKYVKINEKIELDCDPIGQSPVEVTWFWRHSSNQLINLTSSGHHLHHPVNQSSFMEAPRAAGLPEQSFGRRLFAGSIRTELMHPSKSAPEVVQSPPGGRLSSSGAGDQPNGFKRETIPEQQDNNLPFDSSISFDLIKRADGSQSELVRLLIKQARRFHSADFVCHATNQYGSDEKLIKLLVQEPPDPVQLVSAVQVDSRSVTITWMAPFNGNSPITSYTVEWAQVQASSVPLNWSHLITQQPAATISSLQPLTSYEIRVRAHNQLGQSAFASGVAPVLVTTVEEAPGAPPSDIKATPISSSSLQLTWLPPSINQQRSEPTEVDISSAKTSSARRYSIKGYYLGYRVANSNESFVFKTVPLSEYGPLSSSLTETIGHPLDQASGEFNTTSPSDKARLKATIGDLKRSTKYTIIVQAFNSAGPGPQSDPIETNTLADDPPPAPALRVGHVTYTGIELQWTFQPDRSAELLGGGFLQNADPQPSKLLAHRELDTISVDGYHLYYRHSDGQWMEKHMTPSSHSIVPSNQQRNDFTIVETTDKMDGKQSQLASHWNSSSLAAKSFRFMLDQLTCGCAYQIYLVAFNTIGSGLASQILRTKTRGSTPIGPRKQDYLIINSTYVQLNLDAWMDGGCSISNFEIRYKQLNSRSSEIPSSSAQQHWLLWSNSVNPEQHFVQVKDLEPESWYAILSTAESAAGKTELQYTFMTLDKFGQVPIEALEMSNLPALFRSNGSIRSMLHTFSSGNTFSPLVLGICIILVLLASCSLLLIKKYNNLLKDSASMDSRTTAPTSMAHHLHNSHLSDNIEHSGKLMARNYEHYSMKTSPCKTNTTTILSGSSTNVGPVCNGNTSGNSGLNPHRDQSVDLSQYIGHQEPISSSICIHPQLHNQNISHRDEFCSSICESPTPAGKFATMNRDELEAAQHHTNRFKTMPYPGNRPTSTFVPASNYQPVADSNRFSLYNQQQQQQSDYQQQIYSKLRLIYNSNSNYNLCSNDQKEPEKPIYNADTINLALMAQQNQKIQTLKRPQQQQIFVPNECTTQIPDMMPNELSLLMDCQQQKQPQMITIDQQSDNYDQYQLAKQFANNDTQPNGGYNGYGAPSIGSTSTNNSTQPSSSISDHTNSRNTTSDQLINLVNGNSNHSLALCAKTNPVKTNGYVSNGNQQNLGQQQASQANNEQSDYALPFPPKWV